MFGSLFLNLGALDWEEKKEQVFHCEAEAASRLRVQGEREGAREGGGRGAGVEPFFRSSSLKHQNCSQRHQVVK